MRKTTSFWFKVSSIDDPSNLTDDMDTEINAWAASSNSNIVSTSMCIEPVSNTMYVIVVYDEK